MRVRLVSDLHIDVNKSEDFGFLKETQDLLIIAGDTAGNSLREWSFLKPLQFPIVCIGGNHLGYDYKRNKLLDSILKLENDPRTDTKEHSIKILKSLNEINSNIHYLENDYISFENYTIFGGTMYSNFLLYGEQSKKVCKDTAEMWLNDFRCVYTYIPKEKLVRPVTTDDYELWFNKFIKSLKKCLKNTTGDVIVVSHFCPSIKCIGGKYLKQKPTPTNPGFYLNAVYASNLEDFILNNPRIKYWFCGHSHDASDFYIGNCRIVMQPYGYTKEHEISPEKYFGCVLDI